MTKAQTPDTDKTQTEAPNTIPLPVAIEYGGQTHTELTFRDPTAGDLRGLTVMDLNKYDVDTCLKLAQRTCLTPLPAPTWDELHAKNAVVIAVGMGNFFA